MLEDFVPTYDSSVCRKLTQDSGAVLMGKTNMDEFAMGSGSVDSIFGPCVNPWNSGLPFSHKDGDDATGDNSLIDDWYICGGSSGGSAAAVASGAVFAAIGSDTGGSTRHPAALVGVVGFKPSYGLISRHGLIALSHSMDTPGIMSRFVEDAALVFNQLKGEDELDSTTARNIRTGDFVTDLDLKKVTIGIPKEYEDAPGLSPEVCHLFKGTCDKLRRAGVTLKNVSLPHTKYCSPCYLVLNSAEVASNFACYDGIQFGLRTTGSEASSAEELYTSIRSKGFGENVKSRLESGNFFLLKKNYDEYLSQAFRVRRLICEDFKRVFKKRSSHHNSRKGGKDEVYYSRDEEKNQHDSMRVDLDVNCIQHKITTHDSERVDLLLTPVTLSPAIRFSEWMKKDGDNQESAIREDLLTQGANLSGIPAVTIPVGLSESEGLPISIQIMGNRFHDNFVLSAAHQLELLINFTPLVYSRS